MWHGHIYHYNCEGILTNTQLAKLAVLDAYIGLLDAIIHFAAVPALKPLSKRLEPIAHELNDFMVSIYEEPFKTPLMKPRGKARGKRGA